MTLPAPPGQQRVNIEKNVVTVPNKSLGKSDILYREYDRPEVGKALAESHCIEMLRHHHGIANIDAPLEKQRLHKKKGLVTLRRRGTNSLRIKGSDDEIVP